MNDDKRRYKFINNATGYVISYLTIPEEEPDEHLNDLLERRRKELATEHGIYYETIYWEVYKQ